MPLANDPQFQLMQQFMQQPPTPTNPNSSLAEQEFIRETNPQIERQVLEAIMQKINANKGQQPSYQPPMGVNNPVSPY